MFDEDLICLVNGVIPDCWPNSYQLKEVSAKQQTKNKQTNKTTFSPHQTKDDTESHYELIVSVNWLNGTESELRQRQQRFVNALRGKSLSDIIITQLPAKPVMATGPVGVAARLVCGVLKLVLFSQ
jgi:hypothetical protein